MNTKEINRQIRETKESERRDFFIGALQQLPNSFKSKQSQMEINEFNDALSQLPFMNKEEASQVRQKFSKLNGQIHKAYRQKQQILRNHNRNKYDKPNHQRPQVIMDEDFLI